MSDTKNFILETSFKLFLQKSFKEVTMNEIVKATGLSKGAFYHYFPSKEHLFNEIIDEYYMAFFAIDYSQFSQTNLYEFYHGYFKYVGHAMEQLLAEFVPDGNEAVAINYYLLIFDAINIYPGFRDKTRVMTERESQSWKNIVQTARAKGEIRSSMSDDQIAKVFTSVNDGIGLHAIVEGRINTMVEEVLDVFDAFYKEIKA